MRIAVIGPSFTHGLTYQENMWVEHLTRLGHAVRMFHAGQATQTPNRIIEDYGTFEEQAVATRFLPRKTFVSKALAPAVRDFQPELIVVHGDKLFAREVIADHAIRSVPMIATFSENVGMHEYDWLKPSIGLKQRLWAIGFRLLRAGPIRATCRRATLLIGNTPQARGILTSLFPAGDRQDIDRKIIDVPLGFNPEHFSFQPTVRRSIRAELQIADDEVVICASSHFDQAKTPFMLMIIDAARQVMGHQPKTKALIVGFSDKPAAASASKQIADRIASGRFADRFTRHNFADRKRLAELYNASDIAVFGRASISCQEALGTGLVGCFADDGATNHLVKRDDQAVFFRPRDENDLATKLVAAAASLVARSDHNRDDHRRSLAQASRWLGYDRIISSILNELRQRTGN